ncbi:MAG TPA: VOC family protein [Caulobacteraceae bacterium]
MKSRSLAGGAGSDWALAAPEREAAARARKTRRSMIRRAYPPRARRFKSKRRVFAVGAARPKLAGPTSREALMRLRQIALASRRLDAVAAELNTVFGLEVAYRDPGIIHYGLRNAVIPAGAAFIEIVEPVRDDASAARFLSKRGGDAGYMLIFQTADAEAERARVAKLGVRVVDDLDRPDYRASHFHPNDFGGVLTSIDQQRTVSDPLDPFGDWWPAGPDWRAARTDEVIDLTAAVLVSADPEAHAARWSLLLGRPLDQADPLRLPLDRGELRFEAGEGTTLQRIELAVADPAAAIARAGRAGLDVTDEGVLIGGVRFSPIG